NPQHRHETNQDRDRTAVTADRHQSRQTHRKRLRGTRTRQAHDDGVAQTDAVRLHVGDIQYVIIMNLARTINRLRAAAQINKRGSPVPSCDDHHSASSSAVAPTGTMHRTIPSSTRASAYRPLTCASTEEAREAPYPSIVAGRAWAVVGAATIS